VAVRLSGDAVPPAGKVLTEESVQSDDAGWFVATLSGLGPPPEPASEPEGAAGEDREGGAVLTGAFEVPGTIVITPVKPTDEPGPGGNVYVITLEHEELPAGPVEIP
jgi:hypothetical protein